MADSLHNSTKAPTRLMTRKLDTLTKLLAPDAHQAVTGSAGDASAYRYFLAALHTHYGDKSYSDKSASNAALGHQADNPYLPLLDRATAERGFDIEALWAYTCERFEHFCEPSATVGRVTPGQDPVPNRGGVLLVADYRLARTVTKRRFGIGPKKAYRDVRHLLNLVWRPSLALDTLGSTDTIPLDIRFYSPEVTSQEVDSPEPRTVPRTAPRTRNSVTNSTSRTYSDQTVAMLRVARRRGFAPAMVVLLTPQRPDVVLPQLRTYDWPWLMRLEPSQSVTANGECSILVDLPVPTEGSLVDLDTCGTVRLFRIPSVRDGGQSREVWATCELEMTREGLEPYLHHIYTVEHLHRN